jgi:hypothetical protein
MHDGKQYIVLSVAGRGLEAEHVALALPDDLVRDTPQDRE